MARCGVMQRFLSVDPLQVQYPMLTPCQFAGNSPIVSVDLDGREPMLYLEELEKLLFGTSHLQDIRKGATEQAIKDVKDAYHGVKRLIKQKFRYPQYGEGWTTLTPGVAPDIKKIEAKRIEVLKKVINGAIDEYGTLIKKAFKGNDKAIGALGFEVAMIALPGGEEIDAVKYEMQSLKFSEEEVRIFSTIVKNSGGESVIRKYVNSEDDLLKIAEDAAGGSLDNFTEFKPNWWEGELNGKKIQIEWQPGGEPHMGEGPHVKIMEWDPIGGKNGKGKWKTVEKYFQLDRKSVNKIEKVLKAKGKH